MRRRKRRRGAGLVSTQFLSLSLNGGGDRGGEGLGGVLLAATRHLEVDRSGRHSLAARLPGHARRGPLDEHRVRSRLARGQAIEPSARVILVAGTDVDRQRVSPLRQVGRTGLIGRAAHRDQRPIEARMRQLVAQVLHRIAAVLDQLGRAVELPAGLARVHEERRQRGQQQQADRDGHHQLDQRQAALSTRGHGSTMRKRRRHRQSSSLGISTRLVRARRRPPP